MSNRLLAALLLLCAVALAAGQSKGYGSRRRQQSSKPQVYYGFLHKHTTTTPGPYVYFKRHTIPYEDLYESTYTDHYVFHTPPPGAGYDSDTTTKSGYDTTSSSGYGRSGYDDTTAAHYYDTTSETTLYTPTTSTDYYTTTTAYDDGYGDTSSGYGRQRVSHRRGYGPHQARLENKDSGYGSRGRKSGYSDDKDDTGYGRRGGGRKRGGNRRGHGSGGGGGYEDGGNTGYGDGSGYGGGGDGGGRSGYGGGGGRGYGGGGGGGGGGGYGGGRSGYGGGGGGRSGYGGGGGGGGYGAGDPGFESFGDYGGGYGGGRGHGGGGGRGYGGGGGGYGGGEFGDEVHDKGTGGGYGVGGGIGGTYGAGYGGGGASKGYEYNYGSGYDDHGGYGGGGYGRGRGGNKEGRAYGISDSGSYGSAGRGKFGAHGRGVDSVGGYGGGGYGGHNSGHIGGYGTGVGSGVYPGYGRGQGGYGYSPQHATLAEKQGRGRGRSRARAPSNAIPRNFNQQDAAVSRGFEQANLQPSGYEQNLVSNIFTECDAERKVMRVTMTMPGNFKGQVFARGFFNEPRCSTRGFGNNQLQFEIPMDGCGTVEIPLNDQGYDTGDAYSYRNTLIVMGHPQGIIDARDQAFSVSCVPARKEKSIGSNEVGAALTNPPNVFMKVSNGRDANAAPSKGLTVGEWATLSVSHKENSVWDVYVTTCYAHDGVGVHKVLLIDENGCPAHDPEFVSPMKETRLNTGDMVHYTSFQAFKFPDKDNVYFQCTVEVCRDKCHRTDCEQSRKKREANEIEEPRDKSKVEEEREVFRGLAIILPGEQPIPKYWNSMYSVQEEMCISRTGFAAGMAIMGGILLVAVIICVLLCLRSRTDSWKNH